MLEGGTLLQRHAPKALANVVPVIVTCGDDRKIHEVCHLDVIYECVGFADELPPYRPLELAAPAFICAQKLIFDGRLVLCYFHSNTHRDLKAQSEHAGPPHLH
jgi:hypothetical protein